MLLTVNKAPVGLPGTSCTFTVPGNQRWKLRTIVATVTTATGGQPDRGYLLSVTDGTTTVAVVGADDGGTEPATGTITWADVAAATSAAGSAFTTVAPIPALILNPGYVITVAIVNPMVTDTIATALVWYEFVDTGA